MIYDPLIPALRTQSTRSQKNIVHLIPSHDEAFLAHLIFFAADSRPGAALMGIISGFSKRALHDFDIEELNIQNRWTFKILSCKI